MSTASSQSQGSSVAPASSSGASVVTSAASSQRGASGGGPADGDGAQHGHGLSTTEKHDTTTADKDEEHSAPTRTPTQSPRTVHARGSTGRSRRSVDDARPSLGSSLDFEARMRRSVELEALEKTPVGKTGMRRASVSSQKPPPVPAIPLLPPIELQPPSPPQTLGPSSSISQLPPRSAASADGDALAPASLSPTTSSSSLFFTPTGSPHQPPGSASASPGKLKTLNRSPGSQLSASLGRVGAASTAAAVASASGDGGNGGGGGGAAGGSSGSPQGGVGSVPPRRNSLGDLKVLGDLKIPAEDQPGAG